MIYVNLLLKNYFISNETNNSDHKDRFGLKPFGPKRFKLV